MQSSSMWGEEVNSVDANALLYTIFLSINVLEIV